MQKETIKSNNNNCICASVQGPQSNEVTAISLYNEGDRKQRVFPKHFQTWCRRSHCISTAKLRQ